MDTLQWIGNSEDSDKATAAQAGGDNEEGLAAAECKEGRGRRRWEDGEGETVICFSESLKCLAAMLSVLEVSGGMIVLTGFVHRWRKKGSRAQTAQNL